MSFLIGIAACCVAGVFFGSMFVAVRRCDAGDGIFSQWVISTAILCIGFADFCVQGFPGFYPLAMLGGVFWTIGNSTAVPLIRRIGLGLGLLMWSSSKCLTGWITGRFGLLGMKPNPPASSSLNYVGVALVILGGVVFSLVKVDRNLQGTKNYEADSSAERKEETSEMVEMLSSEKDMAGEQSSKNSRNSINFSEKMICLLVALLAGIFYGLTFVPVIYMIDNPDRFPDHPTDGLSYVFSHFFGIFLMATLIFIVYTAFRRNDPFIKPDLVLPSFLAGLLWATAQTSFFIANQHLSQAISFPIITGLPGCVASLWSVLYFKEIRGSRNLSLFAMALTLTLAGATLVGLSKEVHI